MSESSVAFYEVEKIQINRIKKKKKKEEEEAEEDYGGGAGWSKSPVPHFLDNTSDARMG